jgi:hypothetical protein
MMQTILRWVARVASAVAVLMFVALWLYAPPRIAELPASQRWELATLVLGIVGLAVGFWRERFGGFVLLEGVHLQSFPRVPAALYLMLLPALLYLIVGPRRPPAAA